MTLPARILKHELFLLIINIFITVVRLQACVQRAAQGAVVCHCSVCVYDTHAVLYLLAKGYAYASLRSTH